MEPNALFVPVAYWRLVRDNRNYRLLWLAQIVSELGDWFYTLAIYSLLLELTGRAESVALALVLQVLPQTFAGPTAGVVNDRLSRKRVMIAADIARVAIVLSMLLVRSRGTVWLVYPLLLLETVGASFFEPARTSVIPNIAARDQLTTANTLSATTWSFNLAIGSGLGGLVGVFLGRDWIFIINAGSFLLSAVLIAGMNFNEPHVASAERLSARDLVDFKPMAEGIKYIGADKPRLITLFAKTGTAILASSWVLFPVMGDRTFPLTGNVRAPGMLAFSLLMSARGVGALLGPLLTAGWVHEDETRLRRSILLGYIVGGVGYLLLARAPNLVLACIAVVLAHTGASNAWVHSTTLLQLRTDDAYRGRVFSAELGSAMASLAVVAMIAGYALDHGIGVRAVAAGTGMAMFVPSVLWATSGRFWRALPQPSSSSERGTGVQS